MTIEDILSFMKLMYPHELEDSVITQLFVAIQIRVLLELYNGDKEAFIKTEYIPPFPDVYWLYLMSYIDISRGDVERYKLNRAAFKEAWERYREYLLQHGPIDVEALWGEKE